MNPSPRQLLRFGAVLASFGGLLSLAGLLGGCGFTPLYAAPNVTPQLAAIQVMRPSGRAGFLLGQSLDDSLGYDRAIPARYRLNLRLREVRVPRGININNQATAYEMDMVATYILFDIKSGAQVTKGVVSVNATYDSSAAPYASLSGELDGERRAAEAAADRVRLELATYFASPHPVGTVTPADVNTATYTDLLAAEPVQSPQDRARDGAQPGAGDLPDPYGTPGSAPGTAP